MAERGSDLECLSLPNYQCQSLSPLHKTPEDQRVWVWVEEGQERWRREGVGWEVGNHCWEEGELEATQQVHLQGRGDM